jgi:putative Holliday junction resolvase
LPRILAIDYGARRVGLAVTDPLKIIATPLATVDNKEVLAYLEKYFTTESVEALVVGQPFRFSGELSDIEVDIVVFIEKLEKLYPEMPIYRQDEQFSSQRAKASFLESGVKKKKRRDKSLLDSTAATLILQDFLAEQL